MLLMYLMSIKYLHKTIQVRVDITDKIFKVNFTLEFLIFLILGKIGENNIGNNTDNTVILIKILELKFMISGK